MDGGGGGGKTEAERWLDIAERLLAARDLVGSKRFAERALELDPLVDGADQILAVADVLLASDRRVNNHLDWYSILQLPHPSSPSSDKDPSPAAVNRNYRRLTLLLHPGTNPSPAAASAFRLVADAFAVLSDPSKKSLFDAELHIAAQSTPPPPPPPPDRAAASASFWTACPACCHVFQYAKPYQGLTLRCQSCRRPFLAAEIAAPPPIVHGTDLYYCSWAFFPLGFPGGSAPAAHVPDFGSGWKPFYPMFPWSGNNPPDRPAQPMGNGVDGNDNAVEVEPQWTAPSRNKKKVARKKVSAGPKKRAFVVEIDTKANLGGDATNASKEVRGININEEVGEEEEMGNFHIDLDVDATEDVLGNLQNLPFLKDDDIHFHLP